LEAAQALPKGDATWPRLKERPLVDTILKMGEDPSVASSDPPIDSLNPDT
jgi:hypothetical protein